ncbi:MAG TPA: hypothetical protein VNZ94_03350 [Xanthobacteraceae bacterium]|nr:hypothetical protein [Xanthobacteraceae bacterium]
MSEMLSDHAEEKLSASPPKSPDDDGADSRNKLIVDIWKQAVDTQKHFNDMCVKSRQLGLTFVAASLGAALYLFIRTPGGVGEGGASNSIAPVYAYAFNICGRSIVLHVSFAIILAAIAAVIAVRNLDLGVYHQMLRGAVSFGEDLEERHIRPLVGLRKGMTQSISHFSRNSDARTFAGDDGRYVYLGDNRKNAGEKLAGFYNIILGFLAVFGAAILVTSNFLKAV